MVLLHLFNESQTRLADFGYIPKCKSKNPRGLNEISLPLARMPPGIESIHSSGSKVVFPSRVNS